MKNFLKIIERRYNKFIEYEIKRRIEWLEELKGHCALCLEFEKSAYARSEYKKIYKRVNIAYEKLKNTLKEQ